MGAVRLALRAEARQRWRSWGAVALLIAVAGGIVLGLVAAGYRTASAYPRFIAATRGMDAEFFDTRGSSPAVVAVTRLPLVTASADVTYLPAVIRSHGQVISNVTVHGSSGTVFGRSFNRPKILAGRVPSPHRPGEAMVAFDPGFGIHLGSVLHLEFYAPAQGGALFSGLGQLPPAPAGPAATVRVVGIEASVGDFPPMNPPPPDVYLSPALVRRIGNRALLGPIEDVRLRHGSAGVPALQAVINQLSRSVPSLQMENIDGGNQLVERSIQLQADGWRLLAVVAGLAGLAAVSQILARQAAADAVDYPALRALGMPSGGLFLLGLSRVIIIAVTGAAASVAVAFALSPLSPLGEAAVAEPSPGFQFDPAVLLPGALAVLAVATAAAAGPVLVQARSRGDRGTQSGRASAAQPLGILSWLATAGAPASVLVGARSALERGRGREAISTVTVFAGTILGTAALAGSIVFGASLTHLLSTPRLYGVRYDFQISSDNLPVTAVLRALLRDRQVSAITSGIYEPLRIGHLTVDTAAGGSDKGPVLMTMTAGHFPSGPGQIAAGAVTLRQLGAHLGSRVPITIGSRTLLFTVVGTAVFPQIGSTGGLGNGAIMTLSGYQAGACPAGRPSPGCPVVPDSVLIRLAPGPGRAAALAQLQHRYAAGFTLPVKPTSLVNFGQVADLPLLLGLAIAVAGAVTLLHFLLVSVARRRRQLGTLKAIGFRRRQVAAAITWQAVTVMIVAIVAGLPLGLAVGRVAWDLAASSFGVPGVVLAPWPALTAACAGTLMAAVLLAAGPALFASRLRPAVLLRSE